MLSPEWLCHISIGVMAKAPPVFPVGVLACTIRPGSPQDPPWQPPKHPHTADKPPQTTPQTTTSGGHCTTPRAATPRAATDCCLFTLAKRISHNKYYVIFKLIINFLAFSPDFSRMLPNARQCSPREARMCRNYIFLSLSRRCFCCLLLFVMVGDTVCIYGSISIYGVLSFASVSPPVGPLCLISPAVCLSSFLSPSSPFLVLSLLFVRFRPFTPSSCRRAARNENFFP